MTALLIAEESGSYTARIRHPHNGYYAGDFSQSPRFARRRCDEQHAVRLLRRSSRTARATGAPAAGAVSGTGSADASVAQRSAFAVTIPAI